MRVLVFVLQTERTEGCVHRDRDTRGPAIATFYIVGIQRRGSRLLVPAASPSTSVP